MSSAILQGGASGTGTVTLLAPNTNSNQTLTLPDGTGTLLASSNPQSGGIVQVVENTYSTIVTTTSSTYVATGLSASITPKFSTSRILVFFNANFRPTGSGNTFVALYRNGSAVSGQGGRGLIQKGGTSSSDLNQSMHFIDSPATTSATTYAVYFLSEGANGTSTMNPDSTTSVLTLLEIAS